jgi:hypothetical protein
MAVRVLESISRVTPLGLRFWDLATNTVVDDGLTVVAYPVGQPWHAQKSLVNPSGVHVLQDLYGLRELESGTGDQAFWDGLTIDKRRDFILEVEDNQNRFLPFACRVKLPVHGLLRLQDILPLEAGDGLAILNPQKLKLEPTALVIPLLSSPARRVPAGMTAIRASLYNQTSKAPAAWASLEVQLSTDLSILAKGFADENGQVQVLMPYPKLTDELKPSTFGKHSWLLKIQVVYTPVPSIQSLNARAVPDLQRLLTQKSTNNVIEQTLEFGHEVILKSPGSSSLEFKPA